jgi:LysM repeat protein
MKRWVIFILLCAFGVQWLTAQETYYLKVDPSCMDRFEYHINGETKGIQYIAYRVRQSDKDFLFLEVGSESTGFQLSTPVLTDCRNLTFNSSFVDKINKKDITLFIVRKDEIGYNISPVTLASSQSTSGRVIKYHSYDVDLQADVEYATPDVNLTNSDASNEIFMGGSGGTQCLKEYYFHKVAKESCKPAVGLVLVPELGLVKEITGKSPMSEYESTLQLMRINDVSLETYLQTICDKSKPKIRMDDQYIVTDVETTDSGVESNIQNEVVTMPTTYEQPQARIEAINVVESSIEVVPTVVQVDEKIQNGTPSIEAQQEAITIPITTKTTKSSSKVEKTLVKETVAIKCKEVSTKEFHIVQQGETLYGIARRYGVRVDQLQTWNKFLASTSISPCAKLRILPVPTDAPKPYETSDLLTSKGGGESIVVAKTTSASDAKSTDTTPSWKKNKTKIHEVKKGDTYYSIAKNYGYTVERLLEMNGLDAKKPIALGQKLQVSDCNCPADSKFSKIDSPKDYSFQTLKILPASKEVLVARGAEVQARKEAPAPTFKRQTVHVVKEDETISSIAKKYGLSVEQLSLINYLDKNEVLIANQQLFVD